MMHASTLERALSRELLSIHFCQTQAEGMHFEARRSEVNGERLLVDISTGMWMHEVEVRPRVHLPLAFPINLGDRFIVHIKAQLRNLGCRFHANLVCEQLAFPPYLDSVHFWTL